MTTVSGDTVDLTPLSGVCSKITLETQIDVHQDTLLLQGPGAKYLTIDGNNYGRVLDHTSTAGGTLLVSDLTIANGRYASQGTANGGCIYSRSNVSLTHTTVTSCMAKGLGSGKAHGGGVYAFGNLTLLDSTVTMNDAVSDMSVSDAGGGAFVNGNFQSLYSTVSGNASGHFAGAVYTRGNVSIESSTISANHEEEDSLLFAVGAPMLAATILNSTISGNVASSGSAGIDTSIALTLANSTVAFNQSHGSGRVSGVYVSGAVTLQSSIIAGNSDLNGPSDLGGTIVASITAGSAKNLITSARNLVVPADTITQCPKLDVLADNGGTTLTHGLKPTSPAVDEGAATNNLTEDQRLAPRISGLEADIGALERRPNDKLERILASGFDGICDE